MFWVVLCVISGILLQGCYDTSVRTPFYILGGVLVSGLIADVFFRRHVLFVYSLFVIGGYGLAHFSVAPPSAVEYDHKGLFVGVVDGQFAQRGKWHRAKVDIVNAEDSAGVWSGGGYALLCNLDSVSFHFLESRGVGDTLIFKGRLREIEGEYGLYLRRQGVVGQVYSYDAALFGRAPSGASHWITTLRESALSSILDIDSTRSAEAGVVGAMVVGDRSQLQQQEQSEYRRAGVAHLLAISGLHIGIVVVLLNVLLGSVKLFGRRGRIAFGVIIILALWFYALFSGMALSVQRAAIMFTLYQVAVMMHRSGTSLNVLSSAAAIILITDPFSLYNIGFQLSFMAMVGISIFYTPLMSFVRTRSWVLRMVTGTLAVSIGAQLGVLPLIAYHFGEVPWFGVFLSIIIWLTIPVIIFSTLLFLLSSLSALGHIALWVTGVQNLVFAAVASWEWVVVRGVQLTLWGVIIAYVVIFGMGLLFNSYAQRSSRRTLLRLKHTP